MSELDRPSLSTLRHSTAHVLAQAVLAIYPDAKLGIGPAIDDGFYYDFDLSSTLSDEDLIRIEKEMDRIVQENQSFSQYSLPKDEALTVLKKSQQTYKCELISDLGLEEYSFYENGPFVDLCKGPHNENTKHIPAFKLLNFISIFSDIPSSGSAKSFACFQKCFASLFLFIAKYISPK